MLVNPETEKKSNTKLAITVAALGIIGSAGIYIILCVVIFLNPGFFFSLLPIPALSKNIMGLNDTLYAVSQNVAFSDISRNREQSKKKFSLGILDGPHIKPFTEIEPFDSSAVGNGKIYFLADGRYTAFDGTRLTETHSNAIGKNPAGAVSPDGLIVLSKIKNRPVLTLIKGIELINLPLPDEYLSNKEYHHAQSTQLLWFRDMLYLLWSVNDTFFWSSFDGTIWNTTEYADFHGIIKAVVDNESIYLFREYFREQQRGISLMTYQNGQWLEQRDLNMGIFFIDWNPLNYQNRILLFVRTFFSEDLFMIEGGSARSHVRISRSLFGQAFLLKIAQVALSGTLLYFFLVYLMSLLIRKFKTPTWRVNSEEYVFASLFRRFTAKFIDSIVIMLPPLVVMLAFLTQAHLEANPLNLLLIAFLIAGYFLIGGFLYHSLLEGLYGTTIGKRLCGIRVLNDDFSPCNLLSGFLRNLMRIIDSFFYYLVAVVSMAGTLKWQRLGDIVAGTVVVRKKTLSVI